MTRPTLAACLPPRDRRQLQRVPLLCVYGWMKKIRPKRPYTEMSTVCPWLPESVCSGSTPVPPRTLGRNSPGRCLCTRQSSRACTRAWKRVTGTQLGGRHDDVYVLYHSCPPLSFPHASPRLFLAGSSTAPRRARAIVARPPSPRRPPDEDRRDASEALETSARGHGARTLDRRRSAMDESDPPSEASGRRVNEWTRAQQHSPPSRE